MRLTVRQRVGVLLDGIRNLADPWIWIADKPGYYRYYTWRERFSDLLGSVETAIVGNLWGVWSS